MGSNNTALAGNANAYFNMGPAGAPGSQPTLQQLSGAAPGPLNQIAQRRAGYGVGAGVPQDVTQAAQYAGPAQPQQPGAWGGLGQAATQSLIAANPNWASDPQQHATVMAAINHSQAGAANPDVAAAAQFGGHPQGAPVSGANPDVQQAGQYAPHPALGPAPGTTPVGSTMQNLTRPAQAMDASGLGLGMNLNRAQRLGFRQAAASGNLNQYVGGLDPRQQARWNRMSAANGGGRMANNARSFGTINQNSMAMRQQGVPAGAVGRVAPQY
jgi:hypothetical protein